MRTKIDALFESLSNANYDAKLINATDAKLRAITENQIRKFTCKMQNAKCKMQNISQEFHHKKEKRKGRR